MSDDAKSYGGRYAVIERVGAGGMAEVYRARDQLLGREVALKVLSERLSTDRSFVERFRREAQAAANLNHPNIVSLYDYGMDDGSNFIVMEFIDGRSLAEVIESEGALLPERAAEIGADIADALERAHRSGLVHRDIKPGNIMLTRSGQTKVTDFGIARAIDRGDATMTQTGMVMGTASYLSPEQAQGEPVDARSDIYSLGCVLYEMLTGRPSFTGDTPLAIAYKHVRETPVPPSHVNPDVPRQLDAVVLKAMAKNPANRYSTAAELKEDLQRFLTGASVHATPLLDQTAVVPGAGRTEVLREEDYEEEPERKRGLWYALIALVVLALLGLLAYLLAENLLGQPVEVPDVVGRRVDRAINMLQNRNLDFEIERRASDEPEDTVIAQDPEAGAVVDEGDTVTLTVSSGPRQVQVPDVVGDPLRRARTRIENADLEVGQVTRAASAEVPEGRVISQTPDAGERVDQGDAVDLVVSSGPAPVRVPDVVGQTEDQAVAEIEAAGLEAEVVRAPSDDFDEGEVSAQDPAPGTEVEPGDVVRITVSTGAEEFEMPNVIGENADRAERALEDMGLEVQQERYVGPPCDEPPEHVCDQDPEPGERVQEGDEVTLFVQESP